MDRADHGMHSHRLLEDQAWISLSDSLRSLRSVTSSYAADTRPSAHRTAALCAFLLSFFITQGDAASILRATAGAVTGWISHESTRALRGR